MLSSLKKAASALLFPPICRHCQKELPSSLNLLCESCQGALRLLDVRMRCRSCFASTEALHCSDCLEEGINHKISCASCFDYSDVAKSLVLSFKFDDSPYLAPLLAGFMLLQYDRLGWPLPDHITYIPQSFLRAVSRGYNQSALLAHALGRFLERPVVSLLEKRHFTLSQRSLDRRDRESTSRELYRVENGVYKDKLILLVDDIYTTGATVASATSQLDTAKAIYCLTFCHVDR